MLIVKCNTEDDGDTTLINANDTEKIKSTTAAMREIDPIYDEEMEALMQEDFYVNENQSGNNL